MGGMLGEGNFQSGLTGVAVRRGEIEREKATLRCARGRVGTAYFIAHLGEH
jgi:hypothetical protein